MPGAHGRCVPVPSATWAVRPLAASARAVAAPALFLPAWSKIGHLGCLPAEQRHHVPVSAVKQPSRQVLAWVGSSVASGKATSHLCSATLAAVGYRTWVNVSMVSLTETATTPVRQSRAPVARATASRLPCPSAWGWLATVDASPAPNHSVKGTSCAYAQSAPYLER